MNEQIPDSADSRRESIEQLIRSHVARATGCPAPALDSGRGLAEAGFDSLSALELKGSIEQELGAEIPLFDLYAAPSISVLACRVADLAAGPAGGTPADRAGKDAPAWEEGSL